MKIEGLDVGGSMAGILKIDGDCSNKKYATDLIQVAMDCKKKTKFQMAVILLWAEKLHAGQMWAAHSRALL